MQSDNKDVGLTNSTFKLEGLGCACTAKIIEKRVKAIKGIKEYSINPISNWIKITYDSTLVSINDIKKSISKAGVQAILIK